MSANATTTVIPAQGALAEPDAFKAGSDLWVIENNPQLKFWQQLDFATRHLLTDNLLHKKSETPDTLQQILEATHLKTNLDLQLKSFVLIGTANHLQNKWLLIYGTQSAESVAAEISKLSETLHFSSVRLFSDVSNMVRALAARPTSGSLTISFIENA